MYVYVNACVCMYVCMYVCINVCVYVNVNVYIVYMCVVYMRVRVCVSVCANNKHQLYDSLTLVICINNQQRKRQEEKFRNIYCE